ncbi:radical SAM family heme chaperone HemW [Thermoactinomyces sp. DSM 45892]|uniref:radical SAM family heme chaperone HemW n=1 Tax=Thermoactinomyces sp. DSM 45892 TaxID=1882753 RepID=UPI000896874A|nr:radical SAM family heme chaperone HemW [Thermoactinomyces sp. DSM 45892]SDY66297.1 oxygen-independent coproporphyrinogen-3 oxidase [Thermoactinomyces sp. DSM 45892]
MAPKAIYLHIPFCTHKCFYCDFTAYVVEGQPVEEYLTAIDREMEVTVNQVPPEEIDAIFIGGGTPTVLTPSQMKRFLTSIRQHFPNWSPHMEYTIEANPGTTTPELLDVMREGGINRISFGAQTFREELLKDIGRIHGVSDIERSVRQAREAGFENLSLDLMFGLPKQTVQDVQDTLERAVALQPEHFSAYSLKVEEGTLFHHLYERKELPLPNEDDEAQMYLLTRQYLGQNGYDQYEVSNFAKPGKASRHNKTYWHNEEYYGLGTGAHGYMNGVRFANIKGVKEYNVRLQKGERPVAESYQVDLNEDIENFMILGLRLMEGVSKDTFRERYHLEMEKVFGHVILPWIEKGLLQWQGDRLVLTEQGLMFGNDVFASFLENARID